MKRFTILCAIWVVGLCFLLGAAWAQLAPTPSNITALVQSSEYRQPGDVLLRMANSTNAVVLPVIEKAQTWLGVVNNFLAGALAIVAALLGALAKFKSSKASESGTINSVLIQEIQKVATKDFKDRIASAARDAGVSDALHLKVKEETPSAPLEPPSHLIPVVDPIKPDETKLI